MKRVYMYILKTWALLNVFKESQNKTFLYFTSIW